MKKVISLFLSLVMLFSITAGVDLSAYAATSGNYTYTVSDGEATITDFSTSYSGSLTIPSTLGGYPVTSIGDDAFEDCTSLTSITIPDSVTSIGYCAFSNCKSLTSITIGAGVSNISVGAFSSCDGLTNIDVDTDNEYFDSRNNCNAIIETSTNTLTHGCKNTSIPNTVTCIGTGAFMNCQGLASIVIPNSVTNIESCAFEYCTGLTSITIPSSVTYIEYDAFSYADNLTKIHITDMYAWLNIDYFGNMLMHNFDLYLNGKLVTDVVIPEGIEKINDYAFYGCSSIINVTIPKSVTSIGNYAFEGCINLTRVTISDGVTSIGDCAFSYCTGLTSIILPNSVTNIGQSAFVCCESLTDVYYDGTESQWEKISIGSNNSYLTNATVHFNGNEFKIGTNTNSFVHSSSSGYGFEGVKTYSLSNSYKNDLLQGLSNGEKKIFTKKYINENWGGSCYGIAATMGLAYLNDDFLPDVYYNMGNPCKNKDFLDKIQYYQLSQSVDRYAKCSKAYYKPSKFLWIETESSYSDYSSLSSFFKALILTLKSDGIVQFCYGHGNSGHSILIVDYVENSNGSYKLKLFDENSVGPYTDGEYIYMTLSEDMSEFKFTEANGSTITQNNYSYLEFYDFDNYANAQVNSVSGISETGNSYCITVTEDNEFTLIDSDGNRFEYKDGTFDSEIGIESINTIEHGDETLYTFTLSGDAQFEYVPSNGTGEITAYNKSNCVAISGENLQSANISVAEGIKVVGENCSFTASVGKSNDETVLYDITATQNSNTTISIDDEKIGVESEQQLSNLSIDYINDESVENFVNSANVDNLVIESDDSVLSNGDILYCNHDYQIIESKESDCTNSGYTCYNCTKCGDAYTENIDATGHDYKTTTTKATLTKSGSKVTKCTTCGDVKSKSTIYYPKTIKLSYTSTTYNGSVRKPTVTVKDSNGNTISSSNYTVTYASGRKNAGTYSVKVTFKGDYSGTKTLSFTIKPATTLKSVKLSATSYTYNGSVKTPTPVIYNNQGVKLVKGTDYTVTYSTGRKNVGKYKVTIKFKGNYSGTKTLYFTIKPKATSISSLKAGDNRFTVKWKKKTTQTTGYQIQYSTSSKFTSSTTKTTTVSSYKTTSKTIKSLKNKKKYYVRIRTYKIVNGTKYYSSWSTAKSVKTK